MNDINAVKHMYDQIVPDEFFKVTKYPLIGGYNIYNSFRAGGKTTAVLLFALCNWQLSGGTIGYMRTSHKQCVKSKIFTMYNTINSFTDDNGLNYVERVTNGKYNHIYYMTTEKCFRIARVDSTDDEIKNSPVVCYVFSMDMVDDYKSGFADDSIDMLLYDECIDTYVNANTTIAFLNNISTFFRLRTNNMIFMNCNMSLGNTVILQHFGILNAVQIQDTEFRLYKTPLGTQIGVTLLQETSLSDKHANERAKFNQRYMGFSNSIQGIENIRGTTIIRQPYREVPPGSDIIDTPLYIYTSGQYFKCDLVINELWQTMYYVHLVEQVTHCNENITITDDKVYSYEHPYTYFGIGRDFQTCIDLAKHYRRGDVCVDSFMSDIYLKAFYDLFKIPENI